MITTRSGIPHAWQSPALRTLRTGGFNPSHLQVIWAHHLMFVAEHKLLVDPKVQSTHYNWFVVYLPL